MIFKENVIVFSIDEFFGFLKYGVHEEFHHFFLYILHN